jgi:phage terminase large subunit GpA-like protein
MDAVNDPAFHTVVCMKGSQIGATEIELNVLGYHIHRDPAPIIVLLPTIEAAESWSTERLAPMLRDTLSCKIEWRTPRRISCAGGCKRANWARDAADPHCSRRRSVRR